MVVNNYFCVVLLITLFAYPLQSLSKFLFSTLYEVSPFDLSSLLLAIIILTKVIRSKLNFFWVIILLFIIFEFLCFYMIGKSSLISFLYKLFIINLLIITAYGAKNFECDFKLMFMTILFSSILALIPIPFEFYLNDSHIRPKSFFMEPSYAGLAFYSVSSGLISILFFCNTPFKRKFLIIFGIVIFMIGAVLTRSIHITTFTFTFIIIVLFYTIITNKSLKYFSIILFLLFIFLIFFFSILMEFNFFSDHINSKLNIDSSTYTWIMGFNQMIYSLTISPIFGLGAGQTGYFFDDNSNILNSVENHNLYDSYSLLFRLLIEFGVIPTLFLLFLFFKNMFLICKNKFYVFKENVTINPEIPFLFFFSICILFGSLLKEPAYGRSTLFIAVFLLFNLSGALNRIK